MNELIDALRNCADYSDCGKCKLNGKFNCADMMMHHAADAIERLTNEVDRKDKALQAWVTQINKLRTAYDAIHGPYGKECYAFRFGYLDQTVKMVLGITEDNDEQQS